MQVGLKRKNINLKNMKTFTICLMFISWLIATILISITLIGLALTTEEEWFNLPYKLLEALNKQ
jgi:competence protein ComGC